MTSSPNVGRSRRILVADDDPDIRLVVAAIVRKEGYVPVLVNDGREAYRALLSDADFRAAILDMKMPHLEGMDIIRHMGTERRLMCIPVMLMTSERDLNLMAESFAAGAAVFLPKPFTSQQLRLMLRMLLDKSEKAGGHPRRAKSNSRPLAQCGTN